MCVNLKSIRHPLQNKYLKDRKFLVRNARIWYWIKQNVGCIFRQLLWYSDPLFQCTSSNWVSLKPFAAEHAGIFLERRAPTQDKPILYHQHFYNLSDKHIIRVCVSYVIVFSIKTSSKWKQTVYLLIPMGNKRPIGLIAHLRKQFISINTYNYTITLIKSKKKTLLTLWELNGSSFKQTSIPFTQGCIVPSLVEISQVVLEKKIFLISSMYFRYFVIISPWKRVWPFQKGR